MSINSVSDLLQLKAFQNKDYVACQVYNPKGELIYCGDFDDVLFEYGNAVLRDIDINSGMFFISLR